MKDPCAACPYAGKACLFKGAEYVYCARYRRETETTATAITDSDDDPRPAEPQKDDQEEPHATVETKRIPLQPSFRLF